MDAAVFFLSCHLQLILFANIFVARRRTANIRAERRQRRALLMRSRQQRLRAYQEGCGRRRFQFMSAMLMLRPQPTTRRFWTFPRMNDLWQDALTNWDYGLWMNNMRMSRATFTFIVVQLTPVLSRDNTNMRTSIVAGKRVMIALYRLATTCEFRTIGNLFGIGRSTACVIFHEVFHAVKEVLTPRFVTFPSGRQLQQVIDGFAQRWNYPQCAGESGFYY